MHLGHVGEHLGEQFQPDQKAVQRIVVQLVAARENILEHLLVVREVAQHQAFRERALVLEVIEEAALGDADRRDDLLDRGRGEAFRQHGGFRHFEDAGARVGFGGLGVEHGVYQEYGFSLEPFPKGAATRDK